MPTQGRSAAAQPSSMALSEARLIARERGGMVVSKQVPNVRTAVLWECSEGHRWQARFSKVKSGTWCATCAGRGRVTIQDMRRLAAQRFGRCLSRDYVNNRRPLVWRCCGGHVWEAPAGSVNPGQRRKGTWCPRCPRRNTGAPTRLTIEEMRQIARDRGGECLSASYVNSQTKLKWR